MTIANDFAAQVEQWQQQTLNPQVQRFGERRTRFTTSSDTIPVETL